MGLTFHFYRPFLFQFPGVHYRDIPKHTQLPGTTRDLIVHGIAINSSYASQVIPAEKLGDLPKQLGNKTECGLLGFVVDLGQSYQAVRDEFTEDKFVKVTEMVSFKR